MQELGIKGKIFYTSPVVNDPVGKLDFITWLDVISISL
jgi:hypothetical protein